MYYTLFAQETLTKLTYYPGSSILLLLGTLRLYIYILYNRCFFRLSTLSRTLPQFRIKWKSHVVRANTRFGGPTPAPDAVSCSECSAYIYLAYFIPLLLKQIIFEYNVFDASLLCKKIFYNDT